MSAELENPRPSGLSPEAGSKIEDEMIEVRERLAVFYAATMGALAMAGDDLPINDVIEEHLPHGLRRLYEDVQSGTERIIDLAFGKGDH
jgi:hypothetical protein